MLHQRMEELRAELTDCLEKVNEQQNIIDNLYKEIDDLKSVTAVCTYDIKNDGSVIKRLVRGKGITEKEARDQALARCEQATGSLHNCINEKTGKPIVLIKLPKSG